MATEKEKSHWLAGNHDEFGIECIEIIHPSFTKHYHFVRNHEDGVRVKHNDGVYKDYEFLPLAIKPSRSANDLQQGFTIGIGDVGEIMPNEIDRLRRGSHRTVRPKLNYRVYLNSDLDSPMRSVLGLEITDNQPKKQGAVFICKARELNKTDTSVLFTSSLFPSLAEFF